MSTRTVPVTPSSALVSRALTLCHPGSNRSAVRDLSLTLHRGELLAIVGPNGSGKSTWLAALGRELEPRSGAIADDQGRPITAIPRRAYARRVARLPQDPRCAAGIRVDQLVASGRFPHRGWLTSTTADDRSAVADALAWTDTAHLRGRTLETLSGGERRRAWLAMVLAQGADTLLLDEPFAGLDLGHCFEIENLLLRLCHEQSKTLAVVIHDLPTAVRIADRIAVLHGGRLYAAGSPECVLTRETLADVFGLDADLVARDGGRPTLAVHGPATVRRFL